MPEALDYLHRRQAQRIAESLPPGRHAKPDGAGPLFAGDLDIYDEAALPTRMHDHSRPNPRLPALDTSIVCSVGRSNRLA